MILYRYDNNMAHILQHASICEKWASTQAEGRSQELRKLKLNRKKEYDSRSNGILFYGSQVKLVSSKG
jgi:hypothetical protein